MYKIYLELFKKFADSLINTQIKEDNPSFKGGFLCPSCKNIHGRSIDAIYAFAVAYKIFKDKKYLDALTILFEYSNNLICTDGGLYNDLQTEWRFTTTFHLIALVETLNSCKEILPSDLVNRVEDRVIKHSKWLYENLNENSKANINYCTTNALALLLAGKYLSNETYISQSEHLVSYALKHISENNLFYGECQPHNFVSEHGCFGIDIGYNLEESLPALAKYSYISENKEIKEKVYELGLGHLPFILPDGAIDNSLGCRNYKWTYYGSRTCDGIIPLCLVLGNRDLRFIEAANRNLLLIQKCSPDGILYGGVDYKKHHENPCLHHTFEHINALAFAVDNFDEAYFNCDNCILPSEELFDTYIKEMDSYRISNKKYILSISNYDVNIPYSGHLTGGSVTLLFDKENNVPLIVGSVGDYQLTESTNMQVVLNRENHLPGYPRIDTYKNGKYFTSGYYRHAKINKTANTFSFDSKLSTRDDKVLSDNYSVEYILNENSLIIKICSKSNFVYCLPLIEGNIKINKGKLLDSKNTFFLTPGFIMNEYHIESDDCNLEVEVYNND